MQTSLDHYLRFDTLYRIEDIKKEEIILYYQLYLQEILKIEKDLHLWSDYTLFMEFERLYLLRRKMNFLYEVAFRKCMFDICEKIQNTKNIDLKLKSSKETTL